VPVRAPVQAQAPPTGRPGRPGRLASAESAPRGRRARRPRTRAAGCRCSPAVVIPAIRVRLRQRRLDDDEHWQMHRRCLRSSRHTVACV